MDNTQLTALDSLLLGTAAQSIFRNTNTATISIEEYNELKENIDTADHPDTTIKFIEDEIPNEITTPNYVLFFQTATDIIVQANIEYLVALVDQAMPELFVDEAAVNDFIEAYNTENESQQLAFTMYMNTVGRQVQEGYVLTVDIGVNNTSDLVNITLNNAEDQPMQVPAFPVSFTDIYLLLAQEDILVQRYDMKWVKITEDTTPNEFALNLTGVDLGDDSAHIMTLAIR